MPEYLSLLSIYAQIGSESTRLLKEYITVPRMCEGCLDWDLMDYVCYDCYWDVVHETERVYFHSFEMNPNWSLPMTDEILI